MNRRIREVLEHLFCFCGAQISLSGTLNFKAGECETAEFLFSCFCEFSFLSVFC